jgi:hypothetical protein
MYIMDLMEVQADFVNFVSTTIVLFKVDISFLIFSTPYYLTFTPLRIIIMLIPEHVRKCLEMTKQLSV